MHHDYIKWFFSENKLDRKGPPPAAAQAHIFIKLLLEDIPLQEIIDDSIFDNMPEREAALLAEKEEIESATSCEQILYYMRRGTDIMNQQALVLKALDFEDEIVPEIIRMLKTSMNDLFIELSVRVLAVCDKDIAEELVGVYEEIHHPYAKSMILVALGFIADETRIPWFTKKFKELKLAHPEEDFCYGAFFALTEMENRFYPDSNKFSSTQANADQ